MTYDEVYNRFLNETGIDKNKVSNYKPCATLNGIPNLPNSIVVWLTNGDHIIYSVKINEH